MHYTFHRIVLGGTFDHFHVGHAALLTAALERARTLSLGITLPVLYQHKPLADAIESYKVREETLKQFLRSKDALERVTITPIHDLYGTTLQDQEVDAIAVTPATEPNAILVNQKREEQNMPLLPVIIVPLVQGDDGTIISSERIRRGEIDRTGRSYRHFFLAKETYHLPMTLRETLQKPFGKVIADMRELPALLGEKSVISVGDVVSLSLLKAGSIPSICVIDYKTERREIDRGSVEAYFQSSQLPLQNLPGTITKEIVERYDDALIAYQKTKHTQTIVVDGEEDLLALPVMLIAPLGSRVIYGLQGVGMIIVTVTEALKADVMQLLKQF